jgi:hypothetical protein
MVSYLVSFSAKPGAHEVDLRREANWLLDAFARANRFPKNE